MLVAVSSLYKGTIATPSSVSGTGNGLPHMHGTPPSGAGVVLLVRPTPPLIGPTALLYT